jgi:hypothetical protein
MARDSPTHAQSAEDRGLTGQMAGFPRLGWGLTWSYPQSLKLFRLLPSECQCSYWISGATLHLDRPGDASISAVTVTIVTISICAHAVPRFTSLGQAKAYTPSIRVDC